MFLLSIFSKGLFEGFKVGVDNTHVSLLQFEDDTLLFCKYDDSMREVFFFFFYNLMLEVLTKTMENFE